MAEMFVPSLPQLVDAFEYVVWGDGQCVEVARSVPADGFDRELSISFGSVHKVLVHMMVTQIVWLSRWQGVSPNRFPDHTDFPTLDSVEQRWPVVHSQLREFVAAQTPATLASPLSFKNSQGTPASFPLGQLMLHAADHATYHRGQLNSMAKLAGGTPMPIMRNTWMAKRG